ncbi:hypothetical protein SAMN05421640_0996 [Ekhidna lutea]|uniref:Uncharacterized protein n=1 Tax=Ekhidna lutea TaxID=447679 RepID=A0A239GSZ0_EKHLU|nr:hypothetical protein [Ekhidna lutea]SNS72339.1 hypothetical protein SAMN05421640_0996 [Ekhidna lutea]
MSTGAKWNLQLLKKMGEDSKPDYKARMLGRIFRFLLGIFFVTEVWPVYRDVTWEGMLIRLTWAAGLLAIYALLHFAIIRFTPKVDRILGAALAFGPLLAVFIIGYGGPAATGALTFLSVSLVLAAVRADPGCEVMTIPAMFSGKHTHLACLLFSPIDWCERKMH